MSWWRAECLKSDKQQLVNSFQVKLNLTNDRRETCNCSLYLQCLILAAVVKSKHRVPGEEMQHLIYMDRLHTVETKY